MAAQPQIVIMGVFVADLTFRAGRLPHMGETLMGSSFAIGPGGKGSNQSVAAARAGGKVAFIAKLGDDPFGAMARDQYTAEKIVDHTVRSEVATGAAMIYVDDASGDNAIIIVPGSGGELSVADVEAASDVIGNAKVFMVQLEQPAEVALRALQIAKQKGAITVFNPAPAARPIDDAFYPLCDYVTPNESETSGLTGLKIGNIDQARKACDVMLDKGAGCILLTLGEQGALLHDLNMSELVPAYNAGKLAETTGAGDAFNGALAVALADGKSDLEAARFGCAAAAISVTRPGTAPSMPTRAQIDRLLGDSS